MRLLDSDGTGRQWKVLSIHHVAFAHPGGSGIEGELSDFLGVECTHVEVAEGFVERMASVGDGFLQLLESSGDGPVERFVEKRGPALHHVAFAVDDLDAAIVDLSARGVPLVDETPRAGGMGTLIAFIHPRAFNGLLIELVQASRR